MGKYCSGLGITSTRLEQTMCSPWEEAAQPQGERREAGAEAVSISECPSEEEGGGGSQRDLGTLEGKGSILNPSCSSGEGTRSFTPAGTRRCQEGWMPPLLPVMPGKAKHSQFSPFSAFFLLFDSPMPAPSSLPAQQQHVGHFVLVLGTGSDLPAGATGEGPARRQAGHVLVPNPKKPCWGWGE